LSLLAYNLGNLWSPVWLPKGIDAWSLTSLQQRLVKTGGRLIKSARYYWLLQRGEPSDGADFWKHAAKDRSAAITSGVGKPRVGADGGTQEAGKVAEERVGKAAVFGIWDFSVAAEKALDSKTWLEILPTEALRYTLSASREVKTEIPNTECRTGFEALCAEPTRRPSVLSR
jgi:hypothetical protein